MTYKTNIPINYGLLHSGLPLIVVEIKNQNLCFLLDTGSNKNLIDKRVSEFFRNEFVSVGEGKTIGIEGNHFQLLFNSLYPMGMGMTNRNNGMTSIHIEVGLPLFIPYPCTLCPSYSDVV